MELDLLMRLMREAIPSIGQRPQLHTLFSQRHGRCLGV